MQVLHPALRLDRPLGLERLHVRRCLEDALDEVGDRELARRRPRASRGGRGACRTDLSGAAPTPGLVGAARPPPRARSPCASANVREPGERRVADPAPRPVRDPARARRRRPGCRSPGGTRRRPSPRPARRTAGRRSPGRGSPGGRARPRAPATARSSGRRPRSRRPRSPSSRSPRDLGGDEARLGVLVLDLEHADRARPRRGRSRGSSACARGCCAMTRVRGAEDPVRRAVVLLERDHRAPRRSPARTRGRSGCRPRGRRRSTGRGRRPRRRSGARRRGAGAGGTARGSCPGTRPRGRSGRPSASARAPRGSARAPRR